MGFKREIKKENALEEIQNFWDDFYINYRLESDNEYTKEKEAVYENGIGEYGIIVDETDDRYIYMIAGRRVSLEIECNLDLLDIDEEKWAIFDFSNSVVEGMKGLISEEYEESIKKNSDYEAYSKMSVEWYESIDRNKNMPGYKSSLWIPVREHVKNDKISQTSKPIYKWLVTVCLLMVIGVAGYLTLLSGWDKNVTESDAGKNEIEFLTIEIDGTLYHMSAGSIDNEIGDFIGKYMAEGLATGAGKMSDENINRYDSKSYIKPEGMIKYDGTVDENRKSETVKKEVCVYKIKGIDSSFAVAGFFEETNEYKVYYNLDFSTSDVNSLKDAMELDK